MKYNSLKILTVILAALALATSACKDPKGGHSGHDATRSQDVPSAQNQNAAVLAPAEGAEVKILTPIQDQVFSGEQVPLQFELIKGKRGEHVHAYVDGEMAGMFKTTKGTLTGIKPGNHTLEVRVVTEDHKTELDATDEVRFVVK